MHDAYMKEQNNKVYDDLFGPAGGAASAASPSRFDLPPSGIPPGSSESGSERDALDENVFPNGGESTDVHNKNTEPNTPLTSCVLPRGGAWEERAIEANMLPKANPLDPGLSYTRCCFCPAGVKGIREVWSGTSTSRPTQPRMRRRIQ